MNKPLIDAFFIGRSLAESLNQQIETTLTNALSEIGKFDAEQRIRLREFIEQVLERARREAEMAMQGRDGVTYGTNQDWPASNDLQATIDDLRAEVAQLRAQLQRYRNRTVNN